VVTLAVSRVSRRRGDLESVVVCFSGAVSLRALADHEGVSFSSEQRVLHRADTNSESCNCYNDFGMTCYAICADP